MKLPALKSYPKSVKNLESYKLVYIYDKQLLFISQN